MFRLIVIILVLTLLCFSQQSGDLKQEGFSKGEDIVRRARDAAGLSASMTSFQIKLNTLTNLKAKGMGAKVETKDEITVSSDNKVSIVSKYLEDNFGASGLTRFIWNGNKFRQTAEFEGPDGQRRVVETTKGIQLSQNVTNAINSKKVKSPSSDEYESRASAFSKRLWGLVFPFTLIHPIESSAKFEYIGRAQAGEKIANFVQTTSANGHLIQIFFDEKTNNILLLIDKYWTPDKEFETKYYYSNLEKKGDILIPTKFKIEYKTTSKGEIPKIIFEYIDVIDFKINPKLDEKIFEIK